MQQLIFKIVNSVWWLYLLTPQFINAQSADSLGVMYMTNNPVRVETSDIPFSQLTLTAEGGKVTRTPNGWMVKPTKAIGEMVVLTVSSKNRPLFTKNYLIKPFPAPTIYIPYQDAAGRPCRYRGGTPISKAFLLKADGINVDNEGDMYFERLFSPNYRILSFSIQLQDAAMGNKVPEPAETNKFTDKQKEMIKRLRKGDRFSIINATVISPSAIPRKMPPFEVIID